ncbi:MAG: hypothetical protein WA990_15950 [Rubrobacteraceae bacterium]
MRKSEELSTFGRVLAKLMAIRDTFEWRELSEKLKSELGYEISGGAISNYARDRRQPPRHFFNAVRKVLRLNDEMWWLLLTSYYKPEDLTVEAMARQDRKFLKWLVESELLTTSHRPPASKHGTVAAEEQGTYEHEAQVEGRRGSGGDLKARDR